MLKKTRKTLIVLVTLTFLMSIVSTGMAAQFSDVQGEFYRDVPDALVQSDAIYKLNALDVIGGYPDGSFMPDNTITRAEFAKVAVCVAGLDNVASGMTDTPSAFSDVSSADWFNGWVNVAAAQGFVKGYADGSFKPDAQVTQAEVITVLMRIVGYNDNLAGEWPSDYIAKAANLEMMDDLSFVANKAASRGEVAVLAAAALDQNVVDYVSSDNIFADKTKWIDGKELSYTLIDDKFEGKIFEDYLIQDIDRPDGDYTFKYFDKDAEHPLHTASFDMAEDAYVNAAGPVECEDKYADFILNDDDEIIYLSTQNHGLVFCGEMEVNDDGTKIKGTDEYVPKMTAKTPIPGLSGEDAQLEKWYDYADDVWVEPFSKGVPFTKDLKAMVEAKLGFEPAGTWLIDPDEALDAWNAVFGCQKNTFYYNLFNSKTITLKDTDGKSHVIPNVTPFYRFADKPGRFDLTLNDDGEVTLVRFNMYAQPGIVDYVNLKQGKIVFKEQPHANNLVLGNTATDMDDKTIYVKYNGHPGSLEDINEDDLVWILEGKGSNEYRGCDYYLISISDDLPGARLTGTLESVKARGEDELLPESVEELTLNGMTFKALSQESLPLLSVDGGEDYELLEKAGDITGDDYDLLGEEVTLILNPFGYVAGIISDTEGDTSSGRIYGTVIETHEQTYYEGELRDLVKIYRLNDGKEATYAVDDDAKIREMVKDDSSTNLNIIEGSYNDFDYVKDSETNNAQIKKDDFIYFSMTSDGFMNRVTKVAYDVDYTAAGVEVGIISANGDYAKVDTVDTDVDTIKIGNQWYEAEDAVFANIKNDAESEDTEDASWKDVKDYVDKKPIMMSYYVDDNKLKYAVVNVASLSSDSEVAVVKSHGKDNDGWYVTLVEGEEYVKYYVNDSSEDETKSLSSGTALRIKWDAGEVDIMKNANTVNKVSTTTIENDTYLGTIDDINNNSVVLKVYNSTTGHYDYPSFLVDEDTKYFDVTDTDEPFEMSKDDLAKGSDVTVVLDIDVSDEEEELDQPIKGVIVTD